MEGRLSNSMKAAITTIDYENMHQMLKNASDETELFELIVNAPFKQYTVQTTFLFLGIIVLLLVNKETGTIDRVALSNTDLAKRTTDVSVRPFSEIKIDINDQHNIIAEAIRTGKMMGTNDWEDLFTPSLNGDEARVNQSSAGIAYSAVYPLNIEDGGALIFSYYQYPELIGDAQRDFMDKYSHFVTERLNAVPATT